MSTLDLPKLLRTAAHSMFILLVKNKLVLCPQTSRSRTTNCVRSRDFLVFTAWRQKDARKQMAGASSRNNCESSQLYKIQSAESKNPLGNPPGSRNG